MAAEPTRDTGRPRGPAVAAADAAPPRRPAGCGACPSTPPPDTVGLPVASTPYVELDRAAWSGLRRLDAAAADEADVDAAARPRATGSTCARSTRSTCRCRGCSTCTSAASGQLHAATTTFLGEAPARTPFVIGVAGSVAVGKSTTARLLRELLARWPDTPRVELVTTDGFLLPQRRARAPRAAAAQGLPRVLRPARRCCGSSPRSRPARPRCARRCTRTSPTTSSPARDVVVRRPDVLIVEGLNVLQPARVRARTAGRASR